MSSLEETCSHMYLRLLLCKPNEAMFFIHELQLTETCDKVLDLSVTRQDMNTYIGQDTVNRVMTYQTTKQDMDKCIDTYFHYNHKFLTKGLTWKHYLRYLTSS